MRKPFAEWCCNLILLLCVLDRRGDVVKLSIVTLKNSFFFTLSCYRFPLGIMISIS